MSMLKEFLEFFIDRVSSPVGTIVLVCDSEGRLRALDFASHEARLQRLLHRHYGEGRYTLLTAPAPSIRTALDAFFAGELGAIEGIAVQTGGTAFQRRVWAALRRIPAGTTTTYSRLATELGQPGASRAVGLANGANPIGIVVPCHRVIGADGSLTGYAGGVERKRWLLAHERKWSSATTTPELGLFA
jgi:methylated-DNA-[protein]-cysteine S-methyltransferase